MSTSDGISDEDWDLIKGFAATLVNAAIEETDGDVPLSNLISELRRLETKYGRLPSILSTEAYFIDDLEKQLQLLKEAYSTAKEMRDQVDQTFISATLAELYVEDVQDDIKALFWLEMLELDLKGYADDYLESVRTEVREHLDKKTGGTPD